MKRFFLYFLLILFIAGLALLAYGFWNAKNIRHWAAAAEEIRVQHDINKNEKNITDNLNALGGKKSEEFKGELNNFGSGLDSIFNETELAKKDIEKTSTPRAAKPVQSEMINYYTQGGQQVKNLASAVEFLNRVFETSVVFDKMTPDMTIENIKGLIGEAKAKSEGIDAEILPAEMKNSGIELKTATYNYLDAFDQYATGKIENHNQLDASYNDFSQKVNDFWEARKKLAIYSNAQKINLLENKIGNDLAVLQRVKFSIK